MPTKFLCPNTGCGKTSSGAEALIGKTVRCKHCRHLFVARATFEDRGAETQAKERLSSSHSIVQPTLSSIDSIGRFEIREKLGAGAFGTVYRAYDPQLDREVAIKVPNAGVLDNPRRIERFLREARAAANLRHPHIVPVFEAGKDGDHYYIASAFVDGRPLSEAIEEGGMELHRAARLARELAEALAYAHEEGVVHRDVKPSNCMLDQQDRLHLMDFGLAARAEEEAKLTNDGALLGTPSYMAPEQAMGQQGEAQPASDQYAVGVVLYELLTGTLPFIGPATTVIHNVIHTQPLSPKQHRPFLPRDLETICLKAMAKLPKDRYSDVGTLGDDLRRYEENQPVLARPQRVWERAIRWTAANPAVSSLTAAVILLLVVGTGVSGLLALDARVEAQRAEDALAASRDSESRAIQAAELAQASSEAKEAEAQRAKRAEEKAASETLVARREREIAETEKKKAEKAQAEAVVLAKDKENALQTAQDLVNKLTLSEKKLQVEIQKGTVREIDRLYELAYDKLRTENFAQAASILDEIPRAFRTWDWKMSRGMAKCGSKAVEEIVLADKNGVLPEFDLKFSRNCESALIAKNGLIAVFDLRKKAEVFSTGSAIRISAGGNGKVDPLEIPTNPMARVAISGDGSHLVDASGDLMFCYNVQSRTLTHKSPLTLKNHIILAVAFHPIESEFAVLSAVRRPENRYLMDRICVTRFDPRNGRTLSEEIVESLVDNRGRYNKRSSTFLNLDLRTFKMPNREIEIHQSMINGFGYRALDRAIYISSPRKAYQTPTEKLPFGRARGTGLLELPNWQSFAHRGDLSLCHNGNRLGVWDLKENSEVSQCDSKHTILWPAATVDFHLNRVIGATRGPGTDEINLEVWDAKSGKRLIQFAKLAVNSATLQPDAGTIAADGHQIAYSPDWRKWLFVHKNLIRVYDFSVAD